MFHPWMNQRAPRNHSWMVSSWYEPSQRSMRMIARALVKASSGPTAAEPNWFRTKLYTT